MGTIYIVLLIVLAVLLIGAVYDGTIGAGTFQNIKGTVIKFEYGYPFLYTTDGGYSYTVIGGATPLSAIYGPVANFLYRQSWIAPVPEPNRILPGYYQVRFNENGKKCIEGPDDWKFCEV